MKSWRTVVLAVSAVFVANCCMAQMSDAETMGASSVRSFDAASTSVTQDRSRRVSIEAGSTATLKVNALMDKAPARLSKPAKPVAGTQPRLGAVVETRVLETGIDAREFLQIITPTLGKGFSGKQIDDSHIAVTGTTESLRRAVQLSEQIRAAMMRPAKHIQLRAVLLSDQKGEDDTTASAVTPERLATHFPDMHLAPADTESAALPAQLWKIADLTAPASGGGENRVQLTDRMTLLFELRQTLAGDYEVALNLAEKEKGANPFDATVGRIVFANHFRADTNRPVILGVTTPSRTLMLIFRLRSNSL